jgi:hypothetical protein
VIKEIKKERKCSRMCTKIIFYAIKIALLGRKLGVFIRIKRMKSGCGGQLRRHSFLVWEESA